MNSSNATKNLARRLFDSYGPPNKGEADVILSEILAMERWIKPNCLDDVVGKLLVTCKFSQRLRRLQRPSRKLTTTGHESR